MCDNIDDIILKEEVLFLENELSDLNENIIAISIGFVIGRIIRNFINNPKVRQVMKEKEKHCNHISNPEEKKKCLRFVKRILAEVKIYELRKGLKECSRLDSDDKINKCKNKINKEIERQKQIFKNNNRPFTFYSGIGGGEWSWTA